MPINKSMQRRITPSTLTKRETVLGVPSPSMRQASVSFDYNDDSRSRVRYVYVVRQALTQWEPLRYQKSPVEVRYVLAVFLCMLTCFYDVHLILRAQNRSLNVRSSRGHEEQRAAEEELVWYFIYSVSLYNLIRHIFLSYCIVFLLICLLVVCYHCQLPVEAARNDYLYRRYVPKKRMCLFCWKETKALSKWTSSQKHCVSSFFFHFLSRLTIAKQ